MVPRRRIARRALNEGSLSQSLLPCVLLVCAAGWGCGKTSACAGPEILCQNFKTASCAAVPWAGMSWSVELVDDCVVDDAAGIVVAVDAAPAGLFSMAAPVAPPIRATAVIPAVRAVRVNLMHSPSRVALRA